MGDRANVLLKEGKSEIYLYTHWDGTNLPEKVREAIASKEGRGRWDDSAYLNRIIFSRMIKDCVLGETGYGISPTPCDGQDRIIVVDHDKMRVYRDGYESASMNFADFALTKKVTWQTLSNTKAKAKAIKATQQILQPVGLGE
jgi:hypothetical protein